MQANCVGFDEMITKLMRINAEYEIRKKMKNETKRIRGRRAVQESLIEDAKEEPTQFVKTMPS